MALNTNKFSRFQVLAIVVLLTLNCSFSPLLARETTDLDYADLTKLASLETTVYGSAHKNLPSEKRIDSLEKILFGKNGKGPLHSRIYALSTAIDGKQSDLLAPPVAPELDHSSQFSDNSEPPLAPALSQGENADTLPPTQAHDERIKTMLQDAMQLYSQGQTDQAQTIFQNVLKLDNKNPDANFNLGAIAEGKSDWQSALHYYKAAQIGNPNDEDIKNAISNMQAKIAALPKNKTTASARQQLSSNQIATLKEKVNQAATDYGKGDYDSAINNLKTVIAQAPDQADLYYALAQSYKAKGMNEQAKSALRQANKLDPNNQDYKNALAEISNSNSQTQNRGQDTFSNNNPGNFTPNIANSSNPTGEITPFSDDTNNSQLGWQSPASSFAPAASYYMPGMSSYAPSYTYSNSIPYSMSSRLERAAISGLAGAALGSMFAGSGYRGRGAMTGAMVGGMLGLMGGGRRW